MKIVTDKEVYVQKNDIAYLNSTDISIPVSIYLKTFGENGGIINDNNRFEFVKFDDKNEIDFFKNLDWIIDYNEIKDLSIEQLINLGQSLTEDKNNKAKKFNAMSEEEKEKHMDIVDDCELLDFKIYSLRDIIWYKQGALEFAMPTEEIVKEEQQGSIISKIKRLLLKK
ncbi:MAG: hypothetical protein IJ574_02055 [Bacilli bacterium]|nr:hypothetical protein [Bacilli bacterium]